MRRLTAPAVVAIAVFSALNWRAQLQTQQKLDAIASTLTERPPPAPAEAPVSAPTPAPRPGEAPRELGPVSLPLYVIEAPDALTIEVVMTDPKSGVTDRLPVQPISGHFQVRPDGTVGLGYWGSAPVTGLTIGQAAEAIRAQLLTQEALKRNGIRPENLKVIVDVIAYNSKRYYIITDSVDNGEEIVAFPLTGSETVLDAVANAGGRVDRSKIWVARPARDGSAQMLPVDWQAITRNGVTATNYQLLSGDRVYVKRAAD